MGEPNRNTLWGQTLVDELVAGGLEAVCIAPGSRSTPLTVAFATHPDVTIYSHLDERSAAFFALGRARRSGEPTAIVCTSGTALANVHPAVVEADNGRVPLVVLTADRPPDLRDSGANQTIDQRKFYGDAVRWNVDLPEPEADERKVRMLRTTVARALTRATATPAGPVHVNCPFRKPLEPTEVPGDVPAAFEETLAGTGREGAFVETVTGRPTLEEPAVRALVEALAEARRPLLVAGPADPGVDDSRLPALARLAGDLGAPLFADPLSGLRFGSHVDDTPVCGGYDGYLDLDRGIDETAPRADETGLEPDENTHSDDGTAVSTPPLPDPDVVVRIGASPTSKALRRYLERADCRQFLVDPAGGWREATFTATELVTAAPGALFETVARAVESSGFDGGADPDWLDRVLELEHQHWRRTLDALEPSALTATPFEGAVLAMALERAPDPSTVFVSNSMPIRDCDRFACPRSGDITVLGNRGASGIDGIVSTALGAGSTVDEPLVLVTGDLAFYHDSNGLLAVDRCDVDATIVLIDNDGGGIFHKLPIEGFDPPFTSQFRTPHGLDFEHLARLYGCDFDRVEPNAFQDAYLDSLGREGTQILAIEFDAEASHRRREALTHGHDGEPGDE